MKVKVKKLSPSAVIPFKKHASDFCYDVTATSAEEIMPGVWKYNLDLAFEIVRDNILDDRNIAISLRPRSSIYKTGLLLSNCVGTIDARRFN